MSANCYINVANEYNLEQQNAAEQLTTRQQ
jgi:hypothetical protein